MFGLLGVLLALTALIGGNYIGGGKLVELYNPTAALIVVGGTLAASVIQAPKEDFIRAWKLFGWAYRAEQPDFSRGMGQLRHWCLLARRKGMIALEAEAQQEPDPFVAGCPAAAGRWPLAGHDSVGARG